VTFFQNFSQLNSDLEKSITLKIPIRQGYFSAVELAGVQFCLK